LLCWIGLGIPPETFIIRLREVVPMTDLWVGLIKAPVFGMIIGLAGCYQGMQVHGDNEEVGNRTTTAVAGDRARRLFRSLLLIDRLGLSGDERGTDHLHPRVAQQLWRQCRP
jgi:hypothetical protein